MRYLTGSRAFFNSYEDFNSKDIDYVEIIDSEEFPRKRIIRDENGNSVHQWRRKDKEVMIQEIEAMPTSGAVVAFLIPEFANEIGLTINELKTLQEHIYRICELYPKYSYYKVIYDSYIINNSFMLTDEQRLNAYTKYRKYRPN